MGKKVGVVVWVEEVDLGCGKGWQFWSGWKGREFGLDQTDRFRRAKDCGLDRCGRLGVGRGGEFCLDQRARDLVWKREIDLGVRKGAGILPGSKWLKCGKGCGC